LRNPVNVLFDGVFYFRNLIDLRNTKYELRRVAIFYNFMIYNALTFVCFE